MYREGYFFVGNQLEMTKSMIRINKTLFSPIFTRLPENTYTKLNTLLVFRTDPVLVKLICMLGLISLILILFIPVIFIWLGYRSHKRFKKFH